MQACRRRFAPPGRSRYHSRSAICMGAIMGVAMKKAKGGAQAAKREVAPKGAKVVSEVDLLIARLKKLRKGQQGGFDVREAIEDGRA